MASGKKNYFRHDFKAHESPDVQLIVEKFGVHGYYFYFVLAERCAELLSDGQEFPLTFYEGSLRKSLKVSKKNLRSFLEFSEKFLGISSETSEKLLRISWPNLLKYIGSYSKKVPNKIKENTIKENKRKENVKTDINSDKKEKKTVAKKSSIIPVATFQELVDILPDGFKKELAEQNKDHDWLKRELTEAVRWNRESGSPRARPKGRTCYGWERFVHNWLKIASQPNKSAVYVKGKHQTYQGMKSEKNRNVGASLAEWAASRGESE